MRKKVYYLGNCDTCKRIMGEVKVDASFELQDIKEQKITEAQLEEMASHTGSYEALFSKIARKYRSMGLAEKQLSEEDYKKYILVEYTFLKRPVFLIGEQIFVGNAPKTIKALAAALEN